MSTTQSAPDVDMTDLTATATPTTSTPANLTFSDADLELDPGATTEEESSVYESSDDEDTDPSDPIVNTFNVFMTEPAASSDLYVMQFIGRPNGQHLAGASAPIEMRMKPDSGYFEVDVPLNIHQNYNRQKGVLFGEALRRTKAFGQPGYGEAAGFQKTFPKSTRRPGAAATAREEEAGADGDDGEQKKRWFDDDNMDDYVQNLEDANEKGHVLNTVTWGGRLLGQEEWKPNYMVGAFRGNELHLTSLRGIVQLRPEIQHLDAMNHLDAAARRRETTDPKDVLPVMKKASDEKSSEELLKGGGQEKWVKLGWVDSDTAANNDLRTKRLYLEDAANAHVIEWERTHDYVDRVLPVVVGAEAAPPK